MSDLILRHGDIDPTGYQPPPDIRVIGGDISLDDGILTSIAASIHTDRRVDGQRGWWADAIEGENFGSRLWTLDDRNRPESQRLARDYIAESLQWMIDDGQVKSFEITVSFECEALKYQVVACVGEDRIKATGNV